MRPSSHETEPGRGIAPFRPLQRRPAPRGRIAQRRDGINARRIKARKLPVHVISGSAATGALTLHLLSGELGILARMCLARDLPHPLRSAPLAEGQVVIWCGHLGLAAALRALAAIGAILPPQEARTACLYPRTHTGRNRPSRMPARGC